MALEYDLAEHVRNTLAGSRDIREVKMFGGIGFMLNGNLVVAASRRGLLVRVGKDRQREALSRHGARPMEMRGRIMDGYIYVDPIALDENAVRAWIELARAFVRTLPKKGEGKKVAGRKAAGDKAAIREVAGNTFVGKKVARSKRAPLRRKT